MNNVDFIEKEIGDLKKQLKSHKLYDNLNHINDVRVFMAHHVFAVWDFMSLLKTLQVNLTSVSVPWIPRHHGSLARFINEIVLGEESDLNEQGEPQSHFEMYRDAMQQINASTTQINSFIDLLTPQLASVGIAIDTLDLDKRIVDFVKFTFQLIETQDLHLVASAFTFGREGLIPEMFIEILEKADPKNASFNKFKYYLQRHIELDEGSHGPLSFQLVSELCGSDTTKWTETLRVAKEALGHRIALWDAISDEIQKNRINNS